MAEKTEYVLGFYFRRDSVLLIKKNKPDWQKGRLNGVGGKIERSVKLANGELGWETGSEAMTREFLEETGLSVGEYDWRYVVEVSGTDKDGNNWNVIVFTFREDKRHVYTPCGTDEEPVAFYPINALPGVSGKPEEATVLFNLLWLIPMCLDTLQGTLDYHVEN